MVNNSDEIFRDNREGKKGWFDFRLPEPITDCTLKAGDYTNGKVIIERKSSVGELWQNLTARAKAFDRAIRRMIDDYGLAVVVCEFRLEDIKGGCQFGKRRGIKGADLFDRYHDLTLKHEGLDFIFGGSRVGAQIEALKLLRGADSHDGPMVGCSPLSSAVRLSSTSALSSARITSDL